VFTSILCPVDFSPHSDRALAYAVDLAALTGGHLTIVHVVDGLLAAASEASGDHDTLLSQTQREMKALLARISGSRDRAQHRYAIAVVVGEPPEEILKQAKECDSDLIVMGTQGLEGTRRLVFGSTTEHVLRESQVPVLAVPASPEAPDAGS
jgi:nucleotide-binding universal stress UspA family protein